MIDLEQPNWRPSWFSLFDSRLTLGLILVIVFLFYMTFSNLINVVDILFFSHGEPLVAAQSFLTSILYAVPGWGLLKIKNWARLFEIAWSFLMMILGIVTMAYASVMAGFFIIVSHGIIARYLLSKKCKQIFRPDLYPETK